MIKAILMVYVCVFALLANIMCPMQEVRAFSIAVAFAAGMFCYRFIVEAVRPNHD